MSTTPWGLELVTRSLGLSDRETSPATRLMSLLMSLMAGGAGWLLDSVLQGNVGLFEAMDPIGSRVEQALP